MIVLAIDTASPMPAVSLSCAERLFEAALPSDRQSSERLLPAVQRVLSDARVRLQDCDRLAVCSGPGSFTGIRIGLATAWGLSRASGIPVEAVSTLEAMAESARPRATRGLAAVLDAGRGEVILERFDLTGTRVCSRAAAARVRRDEILAAAGSDEILALPLDLAGASGVPPMMLVASALALAVARAPRESASAALRASYSRPSAAEEKRGAS